MVKPLPVVLEAGRKRVFASALDWPGWCRSGKTDEAAIDALVAYAPRYAPVARQAGMAFSGRLAGSVAIEERLAGGSTTDFGAPERTAEAERRPVSTTAAQRLAALVTAARAVFDAIAAETPPDLRKGPRGGGRDRDKMIAHVIDAEVAYARKIGLRLVASAIDDPSGLEAQREAIAAVLAQPSSGAPLTERGWTARFAARRIAWHVLDHAWEMQDRRP